jgi:uncharacterized coiled-coil protein SlyX
VTEKEGRLPGRRAVARRYSSRPPDSSRRSLPWRPEPLHNRAPAHKDKQQRQQPFSLRLFKYRSHRRCRLIFSTRPLIVMWPQANLAAFAATNGTNSSSNDGSGNGNGGSAALKFGAATMSSILTAAGSFTGANGEANGGGHAERQGERKLAVMEELLRQLQSAQNEQDSKIRGLQAALEATGAEQKSKFEGLEKTVADQTSKILDLKTTLKAEQDSKIQGLQAALEAAVADQKSKIEGLEKTVANQSVTIQYLTTTLEAQQGAMDGLVKETTERVDATVKKVQDDLGFLKGKTTQLEGVLDGLAPAVKKLQDHLLGLETQSVEQLHAAVHRVKEWTRNKLREAKKSLSGGLKNMLDMSFDESLTQAIVLRDLLDKHEEQQRILLGHGMALEDCFILNEEATMTIGSLQHTLKFVLSQRDRDVVVRALNGVIRGLEEPGQAHHHSVPLLLHDDDAAAGYVQQGPWMATGDFEFGGLGGLGQAQQRNVPLLLHDEAAAARHVPEGQRMAVMDNGVGEIAIQQNGGRFNALLVHQGAPFPPLAAADSEDDDDEEEEEEEEEEEDDEDTVLYGERVMNTSWALPTEEGQARINTVNAAMLLDPPNLNVAYAQFDKAAEHFGMVPGGRGSNGRKWFFCVSCTYCRCNPKRAFFLSFLDARLNGQVPGEPVVFDYENDTLPISEGRALGKHLEYQEDLDETGPIRMPRYAIS